MDTATPPMPARRDVDPAAPTYPRVATGRNKAIMPSRVNLTASAVTSVRPDPAVWATARRLAGGDARRLQTLPDGSVIVRNGR